MGQYGRSSLGPGEGNLGGGVNLEGGSNLGRGSNMGGGAIWEEGQFGKRAIWAMGGNLGYGGQFGRRLYLKIDTMTGKRVTVFQLKPYGKGMGVILIENGGYEIRHGYMR